MVRVAPCNWGCIRGSTVVIYQGGKGWSARALSRHRSPKGWQHALCTVVADGRGVFEHQGADSRSTPSSVTQLHQEL